MPLPPFHTQTYCLCLSFYSDNKCLPAAMLGRPRLGSVLGIKEESAPELAHQLSSLE